MSISLSDKNYNDLIPKLGIRKFDKKSLVYVSKYSKITSLVNYDLLEDLGIEVSKKPNAHYIQQTNIIGKKLFEIFDVSNTDKDNCKWYEDNSFSIKNGETLLTINKLSKHLPKNSSEVKSHLYILNYVKDGKNKEYRFESMNMDNPYKALLQLITTNVVVINPIKYKNKEDILGDIKKLIRIIFGY